MSRIIDFVEKSKKNIQLSFVESRLFIAIPFSKSLFKQKLLKTGKRYLRPSSRSHF